MTIKGFGIVAVAVLLTASAACGKKGPPVAPAASFNVEVRELSAAVDGDGVVLRGAVHGGGSDAGSISGCIVEHAWYPPGEEPCTGCPLHFRLLTTVRGPVAGPEGFSCRVPWTGEPGTHFYRVRLVSRENESGHPSSPASIKQD